MYNIKLFARNKQHIDSVIHINRIYSKDIRISFRLDKCSQTIPKRGRIIIAKGFKLPDGK